MPFPASRRQRAVRVVHLAPLSSVLPASTDPCSIQRPRPLPGAAPNESRSDCRGQLDDCGLPVRRVAGRRARSQARRWRVRCSRRMRSRRCAGDDARNEHRNDGAERERHQDPQRELAPRNGSHAATSCGGDDAAWCSKETRPGGNPSCLLVTLTEQRLLRRQGDEDLGVVRSVLPRLRRRARLGMVASRALPVGLRLLHVFEVLGGRPQCAHALDECVGVTEITGRCFRARRLVVVEGAFGIRGTSRHPLPISCIRCPLTVPPEAYDKSARSWAQFRASSGVIEVTRTTRLGPRARRRCRGEQWS
jgi:hypothetical protein